MNFRNIALAVAGAVLAAGAVGCDASIPEIQAEPSSSATTKAPASKTSKVTKGQEQALRKAESYLDTMLFSKKGLVKQLEFDKFSEKDSEWAADNVDVDWKEQAVEKANSYLEIMSFSEDELAGQLVHDGFTKKEAAHGASEAYNA